MVQHPKTVVTVNIATRSHVLYIVVRAMMEIQVSRDKINTIDNDGVPLSINRSPSLSFQKLS